MLSRSGDELAEEPLPHCTHGTVCARSLRMSAKELSVLWYRWCLYWLMERNGACLTLSCARPPGFVAAGVSPAGFDAPMEKI